MLNEDILKSINNDIDKMINSGNNANIKLKIQSDKLLDTNNKLEKIDKNINFSEKIINRLNNFSNTLISLFINKNENKKIENLDKIEIEKINKKETIKDNENLNDILIKAKILNKISKDINKELINHNNLLENIDLKTENIIIKMDKIDRKMNRIL